MGDVTEIEAEVTFLAESEGGRSAPVDLSASWYRPHLVVGNPDQRAPVLRDGNVVDEDYVGVQFLPTGQVCQPGDTIRTRLQLIYEGGVDYEQLVPGATFTVREGGRIVGFGRVLQPG